MKPLAKHFGFVIGPYRPGDMSQNDPKTTLPMTSLTENPHPQPQTNFLFF